MAKKDNRRKSGQRRPLEETEEYAARKERSQHEYAQVPIQTLHNGARVTGPVAIVDLLKASKDRLYPEDK